MNTQRVTRRGVISENTNGCASVRVSVPCSSCRHGVSCQGMSGGRKSGLIEIRDVSLEVGERVAVSVSHGSMTLAVALLFGPAIGWALCLAALPLAQPLVLAGVGAAGFVVSLWLGRSLAAAGFTESDVRLTLEDRAFKNLENVSGS